MWYQHPYNGGRVSNSRRDDGRCENAEIETFDESIPLLPRVQSLIKMGRPPQHHEYTIRRNGGSELPDTGPLRSEV